jgi:cysteine desulfuration protein SufE
MLESCLQKQQLIKNLFANCPTAESKYQKIIELGKQLSPLKEEEKIPSNIVKGCQSTMYLSSHLREGKVIFEAASDALISSGLAALLIQVYSNEPPEVILKCPPTYLEEIGLNTSLTPSRSNGLYSIHLRMKQEALKFFMQQAKQ